MSRGAAAYTTARASLRHNQGRRRRKAGTVFFQLQRAQSKSSDATEDFATFPPSCTLHRAAAALARFPPSRTPHTSLPTYLTDARSGTEARPTSKSRLNPRARLGPAHDSRLRINSPRVAHSVSLLRARGILVNEAYIRTGNQSTRKSRRKRTRSRYTDGTRRHVCRVQHARV